MLEILRIDGLDSTLYEGEPLVVALGNFDGVHLGHAKIINSAKSLAKRLCAQAAVFAFDVHPQIAFGRDIKLIMSEADRLETFRALGIKYVVKASFEALKDTEPKAFLSLLKDRVNCIGVSCGYNFRFGKGGSGSALDIAKCFGENAAIEERFTLGSFSVSSSEIRAMVECGRVSDAALLLGRPFSVSGTVRSGRRIGRQMNFPTANIIIRKELLAPAVGIYATFTELDGEIYPSVTNYGNNPTVTDLNDMVLETHLIGFSGDIYDKDIRVFFAEKIRDQKKFSSLDKLRDAISADTKKAELICARYRENKDNIWF